MQINAEKHIHYRSCHVCEALCGLRIETEGEQIISIKPDKEDPFSNGHICPKGVAIRDIHEDPDRIRTPLKRTAEGWETISWEEALNTTIERIGRIVDDHGANAIATYMGNPSGHSAGMMTHPVTWFQMIGTRNQFHAGSVDTWPTHLVCYLMYGNQWFTPIPDIDRTHHMVIIGGNPMASNGSMMTVPDFPGRIKSLKKRGKLVVIDPRRSETAKKADEHHFIMPGTDAWLLLSIIHILFRDGLINLRHWEGLITGLDEVRDAVREITPEAAARHCGISASEIEQLTGEFVASESAVMYGRTGTCTQAFGSIAQWAIQLINLLTGNLDREGGALVTEPAMDLLHKPHAAGSHGSFKSRVSNLPEFSGALPALALSEEILIPGEDQVRGLITIAGNPACGIPDSGRMESALSKLDFMVAIDFYINESTRHADIILPPCSPLERENYDILFYTWSVRNVTRFNTPVFEKPTGAKDDYEIISLLMQLWAERQKLPSPGGITPTMITDGILQANEKYPGLSVEYLKEHPHGVDLGPLKPSLALRLTSQQRKLDAAPGVFMNDLPRLLETQPHDPQQLLLIGRRHVRSNNSWMNNYHRLTKGRPHNQLLMSPADMASRGIKDGSEVCVSNDTGEIYVTATACDDLMPGIISLPHGWGQGKFSDLALRLATTLPGVNSNYLASAERYDVPSGNAVFNGIAVDVDLTNARNH